MEKPLGRQVVGWVALPRDKRLRYAVAGLVIPSLGLYLDPLLLKGNWIPFNPRHVAFAYALIATTMAGFGYHLFFTRGGPFIAGAIAVGTLCAGLVGVLLLPVILWLLFEIPPLSVATLPVLGMAAVGTAPLLIAFVYFQLAREAWQESRRLPQLLARGLGGSGFLAVIAIATLAQYGVNAEFERIMARAVANSMIDDREAAMVRLLAWGNEPDLIVNRYLAEPDQVIRARLASAYHRLTHQDIQTRMKERDFD